MEDLFVLENKRQIIELLQVVERPGIDRVIKHLEETDFFVAPASTRFHGNYDGGLAEHSLYVYKLLKQKNEIYDLGLSQDTIKIAALLHDICKINLYHKALKNRQNPKTLKWEKYEGYGYEDDFPVGHGEKSIIKIQQFMRLTRDEILMIRWHMGGFEDKSTQNSMSAAWNMCKGGLALHTADMEASYILERHVEK